MCAHHHPTTIGRKIYLCMCINREPTPTRFTPYGTARTRKRIAERIESGKNISIYWKQAHRVLLVIAWVESIGAVQMAKLCVAYEVNFDHLLFRKKNLSLLIFFSLSLYITVTSTPRRSLCFSLHCLSICAYRAAFFVGAAFHSVRAFFAFALRPYNVRSNICPLPTSPPRPRLAV